MVPSGKEFGTEAKGLSQKNEQEGPHQLTILEVSEVIQNGVSNVVPRGDPAPTDIFLGAHKVPSPTC